MYYVRNHLYLKFLKFSKSELLVMFSQIKTKWRISEWGFTNSLTSFVPCYNSFTLVVSEEDVFGVFNQLETSVVSNRHIVWQIRTKWGHF